MPVALAGDTLRKNVVRCGPGARCANPVIACPVCSHLARSERTDRGLRIVCGHCSAAYAVAKDVARIG
jgi:hypothetical protein